MTFLYIFGFLLALVSISVAIAVEIRKPRYSLVSRRGSSSIGVVKYFWFSKKKQYLLENGKRWTDTEHICFVDSEIALETLKNKINEEIQELYSHRRVYKKVKL